MPQGWTPDQIKQFQDYWDTEFAGDLAKRRRAKFVPGETAAKVVQTKEPQHKDDFDEWLARIICFAFSVPPQWATKAMNRATADNQSAQAEEEGLEPTKEWVKDLIDEIVAEEFSSPDLELHWLDEDEGDPETVLEGRLKVGALTLNEMRDALGLDPFDNAAADRPMVLTATGFVPIEANAGQQTAGANGQGANAQGAPDVQKYSIDQPRVPAGNPGGGQWTNGSGSGSSIDYTARSGTSTSSHSSSGTLYAALDTRTRTDATDSLDNRPAVAGADENTNISGDQYAALTLDSYDRTGNPLLDRTTDILFQTLLRDGALIARVQVLLGAVGPALYGTLVHIAFASDVRWQDLPGIGKDGVEQSFSLGTVVRYGLDDSVRTDVVMRNGNGQIIAIWDVKTGNAKLTDARIGEIRDELNVSEDVPVIELHICRGVRCKTRQELYGPP